MRLKHQSHRRGPFELTEIEEGSHHVPTRRRSSATSQSTNEEVVNEEFGRDIMMLLDNEKVMSLKEKFEAAEDGLDEVEFIQVMKHFLTSGLEEERLRDVEERRRSSVRRISNFSTTSSVEAGSHALFHDDARLVSNLSELFAQIDINGDGSMEWDEFTSFIVETGKSSQQSRDDPSSIKPYHPACGGWKDSWTHHTMVEKIYFFENTPQRVIATINANSPYLKLYNSHCESLGMQVRASSSGNALCAEHLSGLNELVVGSSDLSVTFFDDATFRPTKQFFTPCSQKCLVWSASTQTLFSAGVSGVIHAWDVAAPPRPRDLRKGPQEAPSFQHTALPAAPVAERFRIGGILADGRLVPEMHTDMVLGLLEIPSLGWLGSASMDCSIRLWDTVNGRMVRLLEGHEKGVHSLSYSEDSRFMVSAGYDYDALVWNPYVKSLILRLHGHAASVCGVQVVPDTPQIVTADVSGVVKVWDIRTFSCMQTFGLAGGGSAGAGRGSNGWDATGMRPAGEEAAESQRLSAHAPSHRPQGPAPGRLWERAQRVPRNQVLPGKDLVRSFCCIGPHKTLVVAGKKLSKFEYERTKHPELTDDLPVRFACYNHTSFTFITVGLFDVKLWDARTGQQKARYRDVMGGAEITAMCLDDRERKFILGDEYGNIRVFDYMQGSLMKSFEYSEKGGRAHCGEVSGVVYNNRDKTVVSIGWDSSVLIHDEVDPEEGILLREMTGVYDTDIAFMKLSERLSLIVTASSTTPQVHIWDYEFARLEGKVHCGAVEGSRPGQELCLNSSVTALCFCEPFPLVVVADGDGYISFWAVRGSPAEHKYHCVLKFKNCLVSPPSKLHRKEAKEATKDADAVRVVTAMEVSGTRLYTANETGEISCWNLKPSFRFFQEALGIQPVDVPVVCENPRRNIRVDASTSIRNDPGRPKPETASFQRALSPDEQRSPPANDSWFEQLKSSLQAPSKGPQVPGGVKVPVPKVLHQWQAHTDCIQSLQTVSTPPALLTVSHDHSCKLFSTTGVLLGVLMQGAEDESARSAAHWSSPKWRFHVNIAERRRKQLEHAKKILEDLEGAEDDSDGSADDSAASLSSSKVSEHQESGVSVTSKGTIQDLVNSSGAGIPLRKTPKLAPVNRINAGKGFGVTSRGMKLRQAAAQKFQNNSG